MKISDLERSQYTYLAFLEFQETFIPTSLLLNYSDYNFHFTDLFEFCLKLIFAILQTTANNL